MRVLINIVNKEILVDGEWYLIEPDVCWDNIRSFRGEMVMKYDHDGDCFNVYVVTKQRTVYAQIHNVDVHSQWYQKLLFETVSKQTPEQYASLHV